MTDHLKPAERSRNMSKIKSKNTRPEKVVRSFLHLNGFRFRLHNKNLPGKPDITLKKYNTVIFVNGCFWHHHKNCKRANIPKSNKDYWIPKIEKNKSRDKKNIADLKKNKWKVLVVWECEVKNMEKISKKITRRILKT
jgi:DNA mismatch endonuclease (patch repair protein)